MMVNDLPFITPDLPGCGGKLKAEPAHFIVEEVPLYPASDQGYHLYISLTREGWTTRKVAEALAELYGLRVDDIGYAGLKDRHARCTQVFSLPGVEPAAAERIAAQLPFQVNWARRHANKLKVGHLAGNRFSVTISDLAVAPDEGLRRVQAVAEQVARLGVPNYFGPQRFGHQGTNVEKGREALLGRGPRQKWLRKLLISAYQSHLFNEYLRRRVEQGLFDRLLLGDVAKKKDTGGMFSVEDPEAEQPRYGSGEIHFTGPLFGRDMWAASGEAGRLEATVLATAGLAASDWERTQGTRRPGRIWLTEVTAAACEDGLNLAFFLPKGSYATVVLREFTKNEAGADLPEAADAA